MTFTPAQIYAYLDKWVILKGAHFTKLRFFKVPMMRHF